LAQGVRARRGTPEWAPELAFEVGKLQHVDEQHGSVSPDLSPADEVRWSRATTGEEPVSVHRATSFAPAALPVAVILVLALFVFLKGRPWWNPQARESPPVPMAPITPMREQPLQQAVVEDLAGDVEEPAFSPRPAPRREPPAHPGRLAAQAAAVARAHHFRGPSGTGPRHPIASELIARGPGISVPVPLDLPSFSYPAAARGKAGDLDVRLELLVDAQGRVVDARVREGDACGYGFNDVALAAARRVSFQPGLRGKVPRAMWTEMIFSFADPGAPAQRGR
jgi:TonB family protein